MVDETQKVTEGVPEKAPREIVKDLQVDEIINSKEKKKKGKG